MEQAPANHLASKGQLEFSRYPCRGRISRRPTSGPRRTPEDSFREALLDAADLGDIHDVRCDMEECLFPDELGGRGFFLPKRSNPSDWSPTAAHGLQKDGGPLSPENVRLAHRLCNRVASIEAKGTRDLKDRAKTAALKNAAVARPELGKILVLFGEQLRLWRIKLALEDLRLGTSGQIGGHGWSIQYVIREDERGPFLEYYAMNRFAWGAWRVRIYADGQIQADLPTLEDLTVFRPGEDPKEAERRTSERSERVMAELQRAGFFQEVGLPLETTQDLRES